MYEQPPMQPQAPEEEQEQDASEVRDQLQQLLLEQHRKLMSRSKLWQEQARLMKKQVF